MNDSVENIPNDPEVTGSTKDQEKASKSTETLPGIRQYPLTDTIRNLADSGVRSNAGLMLLVQSVQRLERDINEARKELNQKDEELKKMTSSYYEMKEENSVLKEKISSYKERHILQNVLITLGGLILGLSTPEFLDEQNTWSLIASLIGAIMLVFGWLTYRREDK